MDLMAVKLTLDSRDVAKMVEKNHADLLRDIAKYKAYLAESKIAFSEFFQENQYKDKTGKRNKKYDITKKGCEFLAHKMTGKKGAIFTATYIDKFHEMEQALKNPKREQTKLDFKNQTPIRTTWKGQPVIELVQLARYINMTSDNLHFLTKHDKVTLRYEKLMEFRKENPRRYNQSVNAISILFKETVIAICKKYGIYEKYKDFIENYFRVDNRIEDKTPKVPVVRANFDKEPFEDKYYNRMFECMKEAYIIESRIEKIYEEELLPLYNKIEELNRAKKDCLISPFNAMKYGSVLGKAKLNK
ncbi:hypothetical protein IX325_000692 [Fusobacterium necrophorum subsp. funduliforme]|uniref:Rha family transcriptional regulator n=1 Tax=Fusobacterium necrophorum TaxID=859 RepID=UPI001B8CBA5D|nr:Rha family transcriptional regulator [Fusobacterium necrophorum]MBR8722384.1 hypothetical protein [Fusobacterium necrophorum subsp. funduliforme]